MENRRKFLRLLAWFAVSFNFLGNPFFSFVRTVQAKIRKIILPKDTPMETLKSKNPRSLDTTNKDVLSNKVFLAYAVNGEALPQKHGFPLRVVAEDYFGDFWVKFVYSMKVEKI